MIRKRHPHERAGKALSYVLLALGGDGSDADRSNHAAGLATRV